MDELKDTSQLGSRGEVWFLGQLALAALVVFAPVGLKVRRVDGYLGGWVGTIGVAGRQVGG